ncbi:Transcriptional activator DEMETER [Bienertia sinuspersici]
MYKQLSVRTAMDGFFPLNGTYFQKNEVFADYETSERPLNVPQVGYGILKKEHCIVDPVHIQFLKKVGFICTRGFDRRTRAPKKLPMKFHNRPTAKAKVNEKLEDN